MGLEPCPRPPTASMPSLARPRVPCSSRALAFLPLLVNRCARSSAVRGARPPPYSTPRPGPPQATPPLRAPAEPAPTCTEALTRPGRSGRSPQGVRGVGAPRAPRRPRLCAPPRAPGFCRGLGRLWLRPAPPRFPGFRCRWRLFRNKFFFFFFYFFNNFFCFRCKWNISFLSYLN